jgi:hypothetical protein
MADQGTSGVITGGVQETLSDQGAMGAPLVSQYLQAMRVLGLEHDDRCAMLGHCQSFFHGTQHDHAGLDWDSMPRDPGVGYLHERLRPQGFVPVNSSMYIDRKPDAPVPLCRQIVSRFTEMLLGEGRRPSIRVYSDSDTEQYLSACFAAADVWDVLSEARDLAGACGSAAIAVGLNNGYLTAEVLNPKHVWVAEWCPDHPGWMPNVVVEQCKTAKQIIDPKTGDLRVVDHWRTRAWTTESVIYYEDVPCSDAKDAGIPIRQERKHGLGVCPVVWYQNTRSTQTPDGRPDCDTAWPLLDKLDRLQSQVYKAATANADPTLVVKEERHLRRKNNVIQKGSNHVIAVSPQGSVEYLEIGGKSVEVGLTAINAMVSEVLQTVECVVISPEYAKAYQSGEALQILWRSMESRANRLRVTVASVVRELCYLFLKFGQKHKVANIEDVNTDKDQTGILLPPRKVIGQIEADPDDPMMPREPSVSWEPHDPGNPNAYVSLEWPPYWTPTAAQIAQLAQGLSMATTQKQVISGETAIRSFAQMLGNDGDEEVRRIATEKAEGQQSLLEGLGGLEGLMGDEDDEDEPVPDPSEVEDEEDEEEEEEEEDEDLDDEGNP